MEGSAPMASRTSSSVGSFLSVKKSLCFSSLELGSLSFSCLFTFLFFPRRPVFALKDESPKLKLSRIGQRALLKDFLTYTRVNVLDLNFASVFNDCIY